MPTVMKTREKHPGSCRKNDVFTPKIKDSSTCRIHDGLTGSDIKWNFTKFLVDRDGNVTDRFSSFISPEKIEARIEETL